MTMKVIAIANHKGGTGKTTTAINVATGLAHLGRRVLLIDLDPQASATSAMGLDDCSGNSLAEVMGGSQPGKIGISKILQRVHGLTICPGSLDLAITELGLTTRMGRESVLKKSLAPIASMYDIAILDCPPSLSLLTINGLVAADATICPTLPQAADLRGLASFKTSIETIQNELNPNLTILGVLICQYDHRLIHHREAVELLKTSGLPIMSTIIGRSIKAAESIGVGKPLVIYDPSGQRTGEYKLIAEEVNQWLSGQR